MPIGPENPFCTCREWTGFHASECPVRKPQVYNAGRILVCGSRDWDDVERIQQALSSLRLDRIQTIIHGASRGADQIAAKVGRELGYRVHSYPANWTAHGRKAGVIRNLEMLHTRPDCVIAFQLDGSRGTQHTIDKARKLGILTKVYSAAPVGQLVLDAA